MGTHISKFKVFDESSLDTILRDILNENQSTSTNAYIYRFRRESFISNLLESHVPARLSAIHNSHIASYRPVIYQNKLLLIIIYGIKGDAKTN